MSAEGHLAAIVDSAEVPSAIAEAVGARWGTRRRPADRLVEHLRDLQLLLVLDNFEQVVPAAPLVGELLAACPRLRIIVTSRAPLRLRWEQELLVSPLALPDLKHAASPSELARTPAVALFIERARAVRHDFTLGPGNARAVAELCVSELVTNAVLHAGTSSELRVVLDSALTVSVRDRGGPAPEATPDHDPDLLRVHGRGLQLVEAMADRWGSERDAVGTTVWFALDLAGGDEAGAASLDETG